MNASLNDTCTLSPGSSNVNLLEKSVDVREKGSALYLRHLRYNTMKIRK